MSPVVMALDKLQGENGCYLATLMPTVLQVHKKLQNLRLICQHSDTLVDALLKGIEKRFLNVISFNATCRLFAVAAVAHPNFKLHWVHDEKKDWVREAFFDEAKKCMSQLEKPELLLENICIRKDGFFDFEEESNAENADDSEGSLVKLECLRYLEERACNDVQALSKYPAVKAVFIKLNAGIPSSAPVERLFSKAALISVPRRNRLLDTRFEHQLLLKSNLQL